MTGGSIYGSNGGNNANSALGDNYGHAVYLYTEESGSTPNRSQLTDPNNIYFDETVTAYQPQ
jgi:hypothetical protein